jgi:hypothetical protein
MRFTFHTQCYLKGCLFRWHLFSSASKSTECIRAKVRDRTIEAACLSSRFNLYVRFDNLVWFGSVWGSCILHAVLPHGLFLSWVINQSCWFIRKLNQTTRRATFFSQTTSGNNPLQIQSLASFSTNTYTQDDPICSGSTCFTSTTTIYDLSYDTMSITGLATQLVEATGDTEMFWSVTDE